MNDEPQNRLMEQIKAARPTPRPSADDWVSSERGRSVLRHVLADAETGASTERARSWMRPRMVITAVILVAAVLALSLSLVFAGREADRPTIAQDSSTTLANLGTTQLTSEVTKLSAVEHVMLLVNMRLMWLADSGSSSTTLDQATLLEQAVDRGLIAPSDISSGSAAESLTQGQYAVLLWKAFGSDWSGTTVPTNPVPGTIDPGEKAAIQGLQAVGVIREADGAFLVDKPLSSEVERLLLARMEDALRGQGSK